MIPRGRIAHFFQLLQGFLEGGKYRSNLDYPDSREKERLKIKDSSLGTVGSQWGKGEEEQNVKENNQIFLTGVI